MDKISTSSKHAGWTVIAFLASCMFIVALIIWQLFGLTPSNWCFVAKEGDTRDPGACFNVLVRLLDIKDHIVVGLIGTLAVIIVCLSVVTLKLFVKADGPGGVHFDIGQDHTIDTTTTTTTSIPVVPTTPQS